MTGRHDGLDHEDSRNVIAWFPACVIVWNQLSFTGTGNARK